jgi:hypothetical protein
VIRPLAQRRADYIAGLDDLARVLQAPDLRPEERQEYLECKEELCLRLQEIDEEELDAAREAQVAA